MNKHLWLTILLSIALTCSMAQIDLSPVNTGDCVAPRISSGRTAYKDLYDLNYCTQYNRDKAKQKKCLENLKSQPDFSFFTDRCSEQEYFIGINGKEVELRRTSARPGKPTNFIGAFAGEGYTVIISNPRLIQKTYAEGEARTEDNVESAAYKVDVTVTKGKITTTFKNKVFTYGL